MRGWRWQVAESDGLPGSAVAAAFSPLLARALWARRLRTVDACQGWLAPHRRALGAWDALPEMAGAIERVAAAVAAGRPVGVFGDYDVDGLAATAIVALTLRALGIEVAWRLPDRRREGYGLNQAAVRELAGRLQERPPDGRALLVVVDCGTGNPDEIALADRLGLDVVVLDHHTVQGEVPAARVVVNPRRLDREHECRDRTAAGLALDLARGLLAAVPAPVAEDELEALKRDLLALAALGTLADVAPVTGANRVLVARGLRALRTRQRPGLAALMTVAQIEPAQIDSDAVVWRVAPRLNAAGRMADPALALRLLLTADAGEAAALARELDGLNRRRQAELDRLLDEARAVARGGRQRIPVLAGDGWSPGLVGLVAGRLAEELGRPVVVLGTDGPLARGSARSHEDFNITAALEACRHLLVRFGGHRQAAGLTVEREQLPALGHALDALADQFWPDGPPPPRLRLDGTARLDELQAAAVADLARLAPFGPGNEEPVWLFAGLRLLDARRVGRDGQHLQLRVGDGPAVASGVAFRLGDRLAELQAAGRVDLAGCARVGEWQGQRRVEIQARDFRPSGQ